MKNLISVFSHSPQKPNIPSGYAVFMFLFSWFSLEIDDQKVAPILPSNTTKHHTVGHIQSPYQIQLYQYSCWLGPGHRLPSGDL